MFYSWHQKLAASLRFGIQIIVYLLKSNAT